MKKALILINTAAGTRKAGNDVMNIVEEAALSGFEPIVFPIIPGTSLSSEELIALFGEQVDLILCSGGDGTLNHVVNSYMTLEKEVLLAYIPSGSTNDFARGLGIPAKRKDALRAAFSGTPFAYDVGRMNERYFNYVAAFGAFADISYDTRQEWKNVLGYAAYFLNAASELFQNIRYSRHVWIETDAGTEEGDYIFGAVCNSVSVGGLPLFHKAGVSLNDGKMELLLIRTPRNLIELQAVIATLSLGSSNHPNILFRQITRATFLATEKLSWALDGEFGGVTKRAEISVEAQKISIMARKRYVSPLN